MELNKNHVQNMHQLGGARMGKRMKTPRQEPHCKIVSLACQKCFACWANQANKMCKSIKF